MKNIIIILIIIFMIDLNLLSINGEIFPPIPVQKINITEELKYIYDTDQKDREFFLDSTFSFSQSLNINDSIRISRVIELDTSKLLTTNIQKYYAAFIYHHGGGTRIKEDSLFKIREISLCNDIINSKTNDYLIDTISINDERKNSQDFQGLFNFIMDSIKIDTIIKSKSIDTFLSVHIPIKLMAIELKKMAEKQFHEKIIENKSNSISLDSLDNPQYCYKIKQKIRENIIIQLKEKSPTYFEFLTNEDIDKLVDKSFQTLINTKKAIEVIKKNPEKYKIEK